MDVFRKWWSPQMIHFNRVFHVSHPFWGTTILGNTHISNWSPKSNMVLWLEQPWHVNAECYCTSLVLTNFAALIRTSWWIIVMALFCLQKERNPWKRPDSFRRKYVKIHHVHGQNRAPIDIFKYGSNIWWVNSWGLLLMAKQLIRQVALLFVSWLL